MEKNTKAILILLLILLVVTIATPLLAIKAPKKPEGALDVPLPEAISMISKTILLIVATIAVLFLIIGGFQYVTSAGNPDAIEKAKATILYAIIGLIACIIAYTTVYWITTKLITPP
jgi:magnesium-transporting ATPase (P-type)